MNAAASIHEYLESMTPSVPRAHRSLDKGPVTFYEPGGAVIKFGCKVDAAISYPSDVRSVEVGRDRDPWDGRQHDYIRDSFSGCKVYTLRVRYADGNSADARWAHDGRQRDELALVMRAMMEAAKA